MRTSDEMKSIVAKFLYAEADGLGSYHSVDDAFDNAEELCTLLWPAIDHVMSRPVEGEPVWSPPKELTLLLDQGGSEAVIPLGRASRPSEVAGALYSGVKQTREVWDAVEEREAAASAPNAPGADRG